MRITSYNFIWLKLSNVQICQIARFLHKSWNLKLFLAKECCLFQNGATMRRNLQQNIIVQVLVITMS